MSYNYKQSEDYDFEFKKLGFCYLNQNDIDNIIREVMSIGWDIDRKCYLVKFDAMRDLINYTIQQYNENVRLEEEGLI